MHLIIEPSTCNIYWEEHPTYKNAKMYNDCGLDIPMPEDIIIPENAFNYVINLQFRTESTHNYMIVPKDLITKTPIRLSNSICIINKNFRENLKVVIDNVLDEPYTLRCKKCYFQIISFSGTLPNWNLGEIKLTK